MAKAGNARSAKGFSGVKVPDALPGADWINGALSAPMVREAIAAALVAGAAAAAQVLARSESGAGQVMRAGAAAIAGEDRKQGRRSGSLTKDITEAAVGTVIGLAADAAQNLLTDKSAGRGAAGKSKGRAAARPRKSDASKKASTAKKRKS